MSSHSLFFITKETPYHLDKYGSYDVACVIDKQFRDAKISLTGFRLNTFIGRKLGERGFDYRQFVII